MTLATTDMRSRTTFFMAMLRGTPEELIKKQEAAAQKRLTELASYLTQTLNGNLESMQKTVEGISNDISRDPALQANVQQLSALKKSADEFRRINEQMKKDLQNGLLIAVKQQTDNQTLQSQLDHLKETLKKPTPPSVLQQNLIKIGKYVCLTASQQGTNS